MSRTSAPFLLAGFLLLGIGGCAATRPALVHSAPANLSCVEPLEPYIRADLYTDRSNRNDPSGRLTDEEWNRFVEEVLVRNFPAGGTVHANSGWWRRPNGTTFHGAGRTLVLLAPAGEAQTHRVAVQAVIDEIKTRYGPRSVGWEEDWVCVAF